MAKSQGEQQVLTIIKRKGIVRPADLEALGLPRIALYRLLEKGLVQRESRGLYVATGHRVTENHAIAQVCARVPNAVICLLTALRFHDLTTQQPPEVWIALPSKARRPCLGHPRLRVARFSGMALTEGIESHTIEAVQVHIYSAAKTVADCFKYRNKVGIDVAVEALRDFTRRYRGNQELARFARICRVQRVMQPYLEAIP